MDSENTIQAGSSLEHRTSREVGTHAAAVYAAPVYAAPAYIYYMIFSHSPAAL